jgi:hypothetical protein
MDEAANRYAQELIEAISAAIAQDAEVQACRARAKAGGFDINVSIEAQVRPVDKKEPNALPQTVVTPPARRLLPAARTYDITAADRRFLRSLRIAAETEPVEHGGSERKTEN